MSTSMRAGFSVPFLAPVVSIRETRAIRRRLITPEAGHALELLGHAIEYLTDEFVHEGGSFSAHNAQLEAVQLLMALNRQVYAECPTAPSFADRCRALLHSSLQ